MFKRRLEKSGDGIFEEGHDIRVEFVGCAIPGEGEGRLPERCFFGQRRQRNPMRGCRMNISAKGPGVGGREKQPLGRARGVGAMHAIGIFGFATPGKVVAVRFWAGKLFVSGAEAAPSPRKSSPASAFQPFSCMNVNRCPSGALFHPHVPPTVPPFGKSHTSSAGGQGQAAATPLPRSGRKNMTLIPPAAAKGR